MTTSVHLKPPKQMQFLILLVSLSLLMFLTSTLATTRFLRRVMVVDVPDVYGKTLEAARTTFRMKRLSCEISEFRFDQRMPMNQILSQDPPAGTTVKTGRTIRVVISRGSPLVNVPDLTNLTLREANVLLSQKGLHLGRVSEFFSDMAPKSQVLHQWPTVEQATNQGGRVDILISAGPSSQRLVMPQLQGLSFTQVAKLFQTLGMDIKNVKKRFSPSEPLDSILEQTPHPNSALDHDTNISLVVNRSGKDSTLQRRFVMISFHVPDDTSEVRVKLILNDELGTHEIYNAMEKPGRTLEVRSAVLGINATVSIQVNGKPVEERTL
jgi:eukaryotic-like serine/threonine-protein kinase